MYIYKWHTHTSCTNGMKGKEMKIVQPILNKMIRIISAFHFFSCCKHLYYCSFNSGIIFKWEHFLPTPQIGTHFSSKQHKYWAFFLLLLYIVVVFLSSMHRLLCSVFLSFSICLSAHLFASNLFYYVFEKDFLISKIGIMWIVNELNEWTQHWDEHCRTVMRF